MKNNIVRAFVLVLAVAGFSATKVSAMHTANVVAANTEPSSPTPMCPFGDPNGCGIH
jgi:hypothetical protein